VAGFEQEAARRDHRAYGVGAGGADADLEKLKYAHVHELSPENLFLLC
jgi:hypothetical protein